MCCTGSFKQFIKAGPVVFVFSPDHLEQQVLHDNKKKDILYFLMKI